MRRSFLLGPWLVCLVMMMFTCPCSEWSAIEREMGDGLQSAGHHMDAWVFPSRFAFSLFAATLKTGASLLLIWSIFDSMDFHSRSGWKQFNSHSFFCLHLIQYNIEVVDLYIYFMTRVNRAFEILTWSKSKMEQSWCIETFAPVHIV